MNKKSFRKRLQSIISNYGVKIFILIILIGIIYLLQYINTLLPEETNNFFLKIIKIVMPYLIGAFSLSTILAPVTYILKSIWKRHVNSVHEEERKTEDNHHKIIRSYVELTKDKTDFDCSGDKTYKISNVDCIDNYYSSEGDLMQIHQLSNTKNVKNIKLDSKKFYSKDFEKECMALKKFSNKENGYLNIAHINIYTNLNQNTTLKIIEDSSNIYQLDEFIEENRLKLLSAHSSRSNNKTIRLKEVNYDNDNILKVSLERSTYFDMLITNRAMDFDLGETTLRKMYEYGRKLTPLEESKFSNQIGITGVIKSKDGYVLLEKRTRSKSTWRDKFGPTISLALKVEDELLKKGTFEEAKLDINEYIVKRIKNSLKNNFNLIENEDYDPLTFSNIFLGLSRDLLEGGKPNMYFCVTLNKNAIEIAKNMQKYASIGKIKTNNKRIKSNHKYKYSWIEKNYDSLNLTSDGKRLPLENEKLINSYYFILQNSIKLDYYYQLELPRGSIKIKRKFKPRSFSLSDPNKIYRTKKKIIKECGEGLLVTFSYLELLNAHKLKNK